MANITVIGIDREQANEEGGDANDEECTDILQWLVTAKAISPMLISSDNDCNINLS